MLNINKNIIFLFLIYIFVLLFELFHFGSDVPIIIMSESFLCFSVLLYLGSFIFKEMFVFGLDLITVKFNYIYIFLKNIVNLNLEIYSNFINNFEFFFGFFIKLFKLHQNLKNKLKLEYLKTLLYLKLSLYNYLKNKSSDLIFFI